MTNEAMLKALHRHNTNWRMDEPGVFKLDIGKTAFGDETYVIKRDNGTWLLILLIDGLTNQAFAFASFQSIIRNMRKKAA